MGMTELSVGLDRSFGKLRGGGEKGDGVNPDLWTLAGSGWTDPGADAFGFWLAIWPVMVPASLRSVTSMGGGVLPGMTSRGLLPRSTPPLVMELM